MLPLTKEQKKSLKRWRVRAFTSDLREYSVKHLRQEFGATSSGRLLMAPLVRNLLWQAATLIEARKVPKIDGGLKSLYYQWIHPVISRIPELETVVRDPYDEMLQALRLFIVELKVFRYKDLGMVDENWENRWLTDGRNPHILVWTQKNCFIKLMQEVHRKYGVTSVGLGGFPHQISTEYLVEQLRIKLPQLEPMVLFGIADYDPSGELAKRMFEEQLIQQNIRILESYQLIEPKRYDSNEIKKFRIPIISDRHRITKEWLKRKEGINGEPFGLPSEFVPPSKLSNMLDSMILPYRRA